MTDERYDYFQSQQQRGKAAHRTPISPAKIASEAENHAKDGPCKVIIGIDAPKTEESL